MCFTCGTCGSSICLTVLHSLCGSRLYYELLFFSCEACAERLTKRCLRLLGHIQFAPGIARRVLPQQIWPPCALGFRISFASRMSFVWGVEESIIIFVCVCLSLAHRKGPWIPYGVCWVISRFCFHGITISILYEIVDFTHRHARVNHQTANMRLSPTCPLKM